jgi:hypothetical protein
MELKTVILKAEREGLKTVLSVMSAVLEEIAAVFAV